MNVENIKNELTHREKKRMIIALIYEHYNFDIADPSDDALAELIMKICEGNSEGKEVSGEEKVRYSGLEHYRYVRFGLD